MSTNMEKLLILQERDLKILKLKREARDIPARKAEIEGRLKSHQQAFDEATHNLKSHKTSIQQVEGEIEALNQKILKFREQQLQIKDNTAYKALEKEIFATRQEIRTAEDRELVLMEEMEDLKRVIAEKEKSLKDEQAIVQKDNARLDQRAQDIEAEIHRLESDRQDLTRDIEKPLLSRYERILKHVGDYALVPIEKGACGGCHMNLPPQVIHDTQKGMDVLSCNFCGRILYWAP
ncbi:MAG TPA: C4-type zinc ribbon domain-containing protein [Kiritimatiellia bacterium]|nr:C4-type zinc ribbon domain-containing protein [Kiritimatiellia bacterium]HNR93273.1 C4-type zinc ribbon domain-containing protein [Kiritimatiellia bacterium]HNS80254.1 C4-type zinc ribbon domain-containing protein [Kiritimatiellia bacterium]HPA78963.1 C4-type zinc ribbon domain-containing protein [Kiritimatiellia bacterium]HQQ05116.1 C4-type zinc ribbon domain-containing protein [Kiritimatiellia bacterium]